MFSNIVSAQQSQVSCVFSNDGSKICYYPDYGTYNTTMPFIKLSFHEIPIQVLSYKLTSLNDSIEKELSLINNQGNINYTFRPLTHLPNRKYEFYYKARDNDFNIIEAYLNFTIQVNQVNVWVTTPKNNYIKLGEQKFAVSQTPVFNLTLELQRRGNCKFSNLPIGNEGLNDTYVNLPSTFKQIPNSNKIMIENFTFATYWPDWGTNGENSAGQLATMFLICREDGGERYAYEEISMGVDLSSPVLELYAEPSIVRDWTYRNTSLKIFADDRSVCFTKATVHPGNENQFIYLRPFGFPYSMFSEFAFNASHGIIFPQEPEAYDYVFNVTCDNLANRRNSKLITIPADLQTIQNVKFHSPSSLLNKKTGIDLNVSVQLDPGSIGCKYNIFNSALNRTDQTMQRTNTYTSNGRLIFTKKLDQLGEGNNKIEVSCFPMSSYSTINVQVDTTPPPAPIIDTLPNTCSLSRIRFTIKNGTDNKDGSGFDYYAYNVTLSNDPDNNYGFSGTTSSGVVEKTISGNLIENKTFVISAWSVDNAGNTGTRTTKNVIVSSDKLAVCDLTPPKITVRERQNNETKFWELTVNCTDTQSGCKPNFNYGVFTNTTQACSYPSTKTLGESVILENSARFCAIVFDNNNNNDTFNKLFKVIFPPTCSNDIKDGDETGFNCGGSCPKCDLNTTCTKDSDCSSGYCRAGICSVPSCTDDIKNGDETGINCGGSTCPACGLNMTCQYDSDCVSRNCDYEGDKKVCLSASCTNDKIDGSETDLNCGGETCPTCAIGKICKINSDCESNYCDSVTKKCDIDPALDTDGDGLPDWWEIKYCGCATCCNNNDDLDGDRYTNLEEYKAGTNPVDPLDKPDFFKLNPIALILLILGVLAIGGGAFLLYMESNKRKIAEQEAEQRRFQQAMSSGPKPVVIGKPSAEQPVQRQLTPEQIALRERLKKQAIIQKSKSRKSVLDEFEVPGTTAYEKPVPVIHKKPQQIQKTTFTPVKSSQETKSEKTKPVLEQKPSKQEPEDDVFAKLKKVTEKNKKDKKGL